MLQTARNHLADPALMLGIGKAVQKPDCHRLDVLRSEEIERARYARIIERNEDVALCIDSFANRQAQAVEKRSYSRISGDTSYDRVTATCGRRRTTAAPTRRSCSGLVKLCKNPTATASMFCAAS